MISFIRLDPRVTEDHLGLIPYFFYENDPRSAAEQIDERYAHGGGWFAIDGFEMLDGGVIKYPGDPAMKPLAVATLHEEVIRVYQYGWISITQPDGSFAVSRLD